jgi:hypothetical protein
MDLKYNLYGVLVHAGRNTQSGHYHCFIRTSSGLWHNLEFLTITRLQFQSFYRFNLFDFGVDPCCGFFILTSGTSCIFVLSLP